MLAASQGVRSGRVHHPSERLRNAIQPAPFWKRRTASVLSRGRNSASAKRLLSAECAVSRVARGSGFQETGTRYTLKISLKDHRTTTTSSRLHPKLALATRIVLAAPELRVVFF